MCMDSLQCTSYSTVTNVVMCIAKFIFFVCLWVQWRIEVWTKIRKQNHLPLWIGSDVKFIDWIFCSLPSVLWLLLMSFIVNGVLTFCGNGCSKECLEARIYILRDKERRKCLRNTNIGQTIMWWDMIKILISFLSLLWA